MRTGLHRVLLEIINQFVQSLEGPPAELELILGDVEIFVPNGLCSREKAKDEVTGMLRVNAKTIRNVCHTRLFLLISKLFIHVRFVSREKLAIIHHRLSVVAQRLHVTSENFVNVFKIHAIKIADLEFLSKMKRVHFSCILNVVNIQMDHDIPRESEGDGDVVVADTARANDSIAQILAT